MEINNTCNIDCLMCKTSLSTRQKGKMKEDILELTFEKLAKAGITDICLHTIGDPLMNPQLGKVFEECRKWGISAPISTNGLLLHRHVDTLIKYMDVSPSIRFSIDGATKETYEKVRFGGKWETLLENLEIAKKLRKNKGFSLSTVMKVTRDNMGEVGLFIERFRDLVGAPERDMSFSVISSLSPDNAYFEKVNLFPNHTYKHLMCGQVAGEPFVVHINGDISVCCRDYQGELLVGNIREDSIESITEKPLLKKMQKAHESGDVSEYHSCDTCFHIDSRINKVLNGVVVYLIYQYPVESANFYQRVVNEAVRILQGSGNYKEQMIALMRSLPTNPL